MKLKEFALEKETLTFIKSVEAQGNPPLYTLTPNEARNVLDELQSHSTQSLATIVEDATVSGPKKKINIKIIRPAGSQGLLPTILFCHGAGWVMGSFKTHKHLTDELAVGSNAAVVFVNYSLSPEAQFPVAIEESYAVMKYIVENGKKFNLDTSRLSIVGDSVGGNMAIAMTLLAKERKGPQINAQVLFYPVTSADMNSSSYQEFAEGPWLTKAAMEWFWNSYEPDKLARKNPLLSPLYADKKQLEGLPPTLVITAENDVLRDEGEAYAHKLMQAGVAVTATRFLGTIHDFVMLNALAKTPAAKGAIALANQFIVD